MSVGHQNLQILKLENNINPMLSTVYVGIRYQSTIVKPTKELLNKPVKYTSRHQKICLD